MPALSRPGILLGSQLGSRNAHLTWKVLLENAVSSSKQEADIDVCLKLASIIQQEKKMRGILQTAFSV